ncbi:MAG: acyltransferase [Clostridia bacterium]|nr:acyltransferase [Clostridia bacterium]
MNAEQDSVIRLERFQWLDNVKAIAIILVVVGHAGYYSNCVIKYIIDFIYEFHMPLFFMLSGVTFGLVLNRGEKKFWGNALNIALIFVIQSVIYITLNINLQNFVKTQNVLSMKSFYNFLIEPVGHLWYLHALFIFYLLDFVLNKAVKNDIVKLAVAFAISASSMFTSFGYYSKVLYMLLFFECGRQYMVTKRTPMWVCIIGTLLGAVLPLISLESIYLNKTLVLFVAITMSLLFVKIGSVRLNKKCCLFTEIGVYCIWIFIFHPYFTSMSNTVCTRLPGCLPVISLIIATVTGVVGPLFVLFVCRKLKFDRFVTKPVTYIWK